MYINSSRRSFLAFASLRWPKRYTQRDRLGKYMDREERTMGNLAGEKVHFELWPFCWFLSLVSAFLSKCLNRRRFIFSKQRNVLNQWLSCWVCRRWRNGSRNGVCADIIAFVVEIKVNDGARLSCIRFGLDSFSYCGKCCDWLTSVTSLVVTIMVYCKYDVRGFHSIRVSSTCSASVPGLSSRPGYRRNPSI